MTVRRNPNSPVAWVAQSHWGDVLPPWSNSLWQCGGAAEWLAVLIGSLGMGLPPIPGSNELSRPWFERFGLFRVEIWGLQRSRTRCGSAAEPLRGWLPSLVDWGWDCHPFREPMSSAGLSPSDLVCSRLRSGSEAPLSATLSGSL
jgi:hypothetical protein